MSITQRRVYLDTETTGLGKDAGIVEIGICDDFGNTLLSSFVNPWPHKSWPEAQAIHGITPEMVKYAPLIHDLWPVIFRIIQGAKVVIYNADYDVKFFPNGSLQYCQIECAMKRFGAAKGVMGSRGGYKWWKLVDAAAEVGHDWGASQAHRAVGDSLAARSVTHWCDEQDKLKERQLVTSDLSLS